MNEKRYIPVPKWSHFHPWPTVSGLRGLIVRSKDNGFSKVIKKVGKSLLIDEEEFFKWVEDKNTFNK